MDIGHFSSIGMRSYNYIVTLATGWTPAREGTLEHQHVWLTAVAIPRIPAVACFLSWYFHHIQVHVYKLRVRHVD
jgi:hypothetical protein